MEEVRCEACYYWQANGCARGPIIKLCSWYVERAAVGTYLSGREETFVHRDNHHKSRTVKEVVV